MKNIFQKLKKPLLAIIILIIGVLIFSQTALGKRLNLPAGIIEAVKVFFAGNPNLSACDYKDGTIILIKPIKTGVGDGAYEAGDIVEIRDGTALCERFGNGDPLGKMEKTNLLPVYYPAKLTEKQKIGLTEIERIDDGSKYGKIAKRRQEGVDYTKFLSDTEILKVRSFEKLDRLPEIDLSAVIDKKSGLSLNWETKKPAKMADLREFRSETISSELALIISISERQFLSSVFVDNRNTGSLGDGPAGNRTPETLVLTQSSSQTGPITDLSYQIKNNNSNSVVQLSDRLAKIENFRNSVKKVVRKIIPFALAGTGGTKTICTSGCDYTTLNGWEGTEQGILVEPAIAQITGSFQDTTSVVIDGWTTTAANYIYIYTTAAARHAGVYSTSKYRLEATPSNYAVIYAYEDFVRIEGLQIKPTGAGVYTHGITAEGIAAGADFRVSNNIFNGANNGASKSEFLGIQLYTTAGATAVMTAWNNMIYDFNESAGWGILQGSSGGTLKAYNNTLHSNYVGMNKPAAGAFIAKNNLIKGAGSQPASGVFDVGTDYNATDDWTMSYTVTGGGNTHDRLSQTLTFNNEAGDDFHLASGDAGAKDFGTDLSGDANLAFTDDIDGNHRPQGVAWDIGADEYGHKTVIGKPQTNFMNDDSLVGYWSFDGQNMDWSQSTAEARDVSGNANHGDVINFTNSSAVPGISGQALSFDGSDDKVTVPGTATLRFFSSSFTTSAWVKLGSTAASNHDIIGNADSAYWFGAYGDEFFLGFSDTGGSGYTECRSSTANLDMSNFYHLVATFDDSANQIKLYLNGANVAAETAYGQGCSPTDNPNTDIGDVGIGFTAEGAGSEFFSGLIDEVRVYNRALSASEISDLYKAGAAKMQTNSPQTNFMKDSGLKGYWSFDGSATNWSSATAGTTNDLSGNNNTGTLTNMSRSSSPTIGKNGQALSFDGVDDYVSSNGSSLDITGNQITVSVWIKPTNPPTVAGSHYTIARKANVTDKFILRLTGSGGSDSNIYWNVQADAIMTMQTGNVPGNTWTHVVGIYDGSKIYIYKNGVSIGSPVSGSGNIVSDTDALYIGSQGGTQRYFKGLIDEVRIYNRALGAGEIQALYQAGVRKVKFTP